jgi:hypothetical protein
MKSGNTKALVAQVIQDLVSAHLNVLLSGGWAEELQNLIPPRPHKDIDFVYLANDFTAVEAYIQQRELPEIMAKHVSHKRAFLVEGVMVELILVQPGPAGNVSTYWDRVSFKWPDPLMATAPDNIRCLSPTALHFYHRIYEEIKHVAPRPSRRRLPAL